MSDGGQTISQAVATRKTKQWARMVTFERIVWGDRSQLIDAPRHFANLLLCDCHF